MAFHSLSVEQFFLQVRLQTGHWIAQVTAATKSVPSADRDEVVDWFSGSEKELTLRCDPLNLFFHPLPSGQHALGIIYPAQRSFFSLFQQPQTYNVRVLIVSPQCLHEHGNHPVALFESLQQQHQIPFVSQPPNQLLPLVPAASSLQINVPLLENVVKRLGAMALAQLMQSLFNAESTLFTSKSVSALSVLSALFDLLPPQYRPELTFSSDFFLTVKNSFLVSGFSRLQHRTIRLMKQWGVPVISLERSNKGSVETLDPWARFVYQLLQQRNFDFLERCWNSEYGSTLSPMESQQIMWDNLHEVGVLLSKAMLTGALPERHVLVTEMSSHTLEELRCVAAVDQMLPIMSDPKPSTVKPMSDQRLGERFPQFREELSELEVYLVRGIFGDESVLPKIKRVWFQLIPQLDAGTKETIQETVIATIHAVLASLEGDAGQRLRRSSQLLELMVFFLQEKRGEIISGQNNEKTTS
ncbi:MAG: hypothetical protein LBI05_05165 [Planctomycetaceae bacterium]|jgi:hypothetical protein|nr:hypothetical protein [Planctomycetaceae bacterium]